MLIAKEMPSGELKILKDPSYNEGRLRVRGDSDEYDVLGFFGGGLWGR